MQYERWRDYSLHRQSRLGREGFPSGFQANISSPDLEWNGYASLLDNQHDEATCACIPKEDTLEIHSSDLLALKSSFAFVLCQLTCPLRTIYGKKGDWTFYGKKSQHRSIQVRPAHSMFESEQIGGCHFEHAKKLHRTRVIHCICEAQGGFDSLFASVSDGSAFQTQKQKLMVSYQKTNWR